MSEDSRVKTKGRELASSISLNDTWETEADSIVISKRKRGIGVSGKDVGENIPEA
jgi:hypothetical protein